MLIAVIIIHSFTHSNVSYLRHSNAHTRRNIYGKFAQIAQYLFYFSCYSRTEQSWREWQKKWRRVNSYKFLIYEKMRCNCSMWNYAPAWRMWHALFEYLYEIRLLGAIVNPRILHKNFECWHFFFDFSIFVKKKSSPRIKSKRSIGRISRSIESQMCQLNVYTQNILMYSYFDMHW